MPLFAPVTRARLPAWLGMSAAVQPFPTTSFATDLVMPSFCLSFLLLVIPARNLLLSFRLASGMASEAPHVLVKNAVGFQVPGCKKNHQHHAHRPTEHPNRQRAYYRFAAFLRRLAKDHSAGQTDSSRQREQNHRIPNPLFRIACRHKERMTENGAQREHA